jgi:antitoxin VapB
MEETVMRHKARLFMNGRSQAVRLPAVFRFNSKEVYIRKDPVTGDVILSRKPGSWDEFFTLLETIEVPEDYMNDRDNELPPEHELF